MIPYEFHLTVKCDPSRFSTFAGACRSMDVKPLILDLHTREGAKFQEMMTSYSAKFENDQDAREAVNVQQAVLEAYGFPTIRTKIESSPDHPMAPKMDSDQMPVGSYFESHLGVRLFNEDEIDELAEWIEDTGHISRNVFKRHEDGSVTVMVTMRDYEGPVGQFRFAVDCVKKAIEVKWAVDKVIIEFIVDDTSAEPDKEWLA